MTKKTGLAIFTALFFFLASGAQAKNPISSYFSRFLDESKAEIAIGALLRQAFAETIKPVASLSADPGLNELARTFAPRLPRPTLLYDILVLDSRIPGEIPLPGGTIILTTGLLEMAVHSEQRAFIVARNQMHVALRHPINLMKAEGIYAGFLQLLKLPQQQRDPRRVRNLLKDYLRAVGKMNQLEADRRTLPLMENPTAVRKAMIPILQQLEEMVWPLPPWEWGDLQDRIQALEAPGL